MGFYKTRENYFKKIAEDHPLIKHGKPVSVSDDSLRESFFRINDEEELSAACRKWIHFPCLVMVSMSGGDINKKGALKQRNNNILMILTKLELDENNPLEAPAITEAFDSTFDVMQDVKKKVYDDADLDDEDDCDSPFLDITPAKWEQIGPVHDDLFGWFLEFDDETKSIK